MRSISSSSSSERYYFTTVGEQSLSPCQLAFVFSPQQMLRDWYILYECYASHRKAKKYVYSYLDNKILSS